MVENLRKTKDFIPELSLVAEKEGRLLGHILLSPIEVVNDKQSFPSLALAPVSVLPEEQGKGIGSALIFESHKRAIKLNYKSIILVGHAHFYPRFGYKPSHFFDIKFPFDLPKENGMAIELFDDSLKQVSGVVKYPPAFFQ